LPELIPEFNQYEYIDLVPLLVSYYNSVILLGIPLFCLGVTISHGWNEFIVNAIIWIGFLLYSNFYFRRVQENLKSNGLELKTLFERFKNKKFYESERQIAEIKTLYREPRKTNENRSYNRQSRKKVA
jgi:hypothetical protein